MARAEPPQPRDPQEPTDAEVDRAFADLTADLRSPDPSGLGWDRSEDHRGSCAPSAEPDLDSWTVGADVGPAGEENDGQAGAGPAGSPAGGTLGGPRDYVGPDELDEHFVPPDPRPLAGLDPLTIGSWFAAVVGPIALVVLLVLWPSAPWPIRGGLVAIGILGWVGVIWRMPRHRSDSDDDGAVV